MTKTNKLKLLTLVVPTLIQLPVMYHILTRPGDTGVSLVFVGILSLIYSAISTVVLLYSVDTVIESIRHFNGVEFVLPSKLPLPKQEELEIEQEGGTYPPEGVGVSTPPTESEFSIMDYPKKVRNKIKAFRTAYRACIDNNVDTERDWRRYPEGKDRNRAKFLHDMTNAIVGLNLDSTPDELVRDINEEAYSV